MSVTIAALMSVRGGSLARAADPDFSNVTDILGGQTHLLRDDDLVLGQLPNFSSMSS
jgi:hypothetical protein